MQKMFRYQIFFETQKVSPTMSFDTVRYQLSDGKLWCPLFFYPRNFSMPEIFLKHRIDNVQSFWVLWDKRFPREISDIPILCKRCFDTKVFLRHGRGPRQNFSALWDKSLSIDVSDMPFLCMRFFDTRFFLKHRRVSLRKLSVMWDKKQDRNLWSNPSSLIHLNFRYRNFFWNTGGFFYEMFRYGERKQFLRNIVIPAPSLFPRIFRYHSFL